MVTTLQASCSYESFPKAETPIPPGCFGNAETPKQPGTQRSWVPWSCDIVTTLPLFLNCFQSLALPNSKELNAVAHY